MKKIISVVGARPNFMKIAPLYKSLRKYEGQIRHLLCHTGQHYDVPMSGVFIDELDLPTPDFHLGVGSGSHAEQTARVMIEFDKILEAEKPEMIIVVGDVNSTIACALVATKLQIEVAHVEAGLRSFDRQMPEEVNRVLTDAISDYLFVSERSGLVNLEREGIPREKTAFVGNTMIDSLIYYLPRARSSTIHKKLALDKSGYILVTLHRPSNVDSRENLTGIVQFLNALALERAIVFPVHPRTRTKLLEYGLNTLLATKIHLVDPIGYIDFIALTMNAKLVLTDSGGIQEESTYLGVQCITLRSSTERPVTVEIGTNHLVGTDLGKAKETALAILGGQLKLGQIPELWDGKTSERIASILQRHLN